MNKTIYLSGAMTDVPEDFSRGWRKLIKNKFVVIDTPVNFFDPWEHFTFDDTEGYDPKLVMDIDLYGLRNSDIVIANFDVNSKSLGTMGEIAIAYELRKPIIGMVNFNEKLHDWQEAIVDCYFDTRDINCFDNVVDFISKQYLR